MGMARLFLDHMDFTWELFNVANAVNVVDGPTISCMYGFHMRLEKEN